MKKLTTTILAGLAAIAIFLPLIDMPASAYTVGLAKIKRDNTEIIRERTVSRSWEQRIEIACTVNAGTTVEIKIDGGPGYWDMNGVVVRDGSRRGCEGWVHESALELLSGNRELEVFTAGIWAFDGPHVPVFRTRNEFFKARNSVQTSRRYQYRERACIIPVGVRVEFTPYRDWGLGYAKWKAQTGYVCEGWIDRGVIR